mgnify:CR=1 FL=1
MADVKYNRIIEICSPNYPKIDTHNDKSVISLKLLCDGGRAAGDRWPAGGATEVKSNSIIEISGPNNPKIDTHNDIFVIFF